MELLFIIEQQKIILKLKKKMKFYYVTLVANINLEPQMLQEQFVFQIKKNISKIFIQMF